MAKKYLSLEEAAEMLGISEDELKRVREKGDIRGFADRGNWKFREEDVQEYGRELNADSAPDVNLFDDNVLGSEPEELSEQPTEIRKAAEESVLADDIVTADADEGASDSGVRMVLDLDADDDDDDVPQTHDAIPVATESSGEIPLALGDSDDVLDLQDGSAESSGDDSAASSVDIPLQLGDSDGELKLEAGSDESASADIDLQLGDSDELSLEGEEGSSEELPLALDDSDSDVKLATDPDDESLADSSEEVLLTGQDSDSDVRLLDQTVPMVDTGSDSDVRLIKTDSDSDVKLIGSDSDSDVRLLSPEGTAPGSDSDVSLSEGHGDTEVAIQLDGAGLDEDDESVLAIDDDSGIALAEDSGISLEAPVDSGISLDVADDSGISLDADSDISLAVDDDEGLTLDPVGDSGIALDMPTDSGISLDDGGTGTVPAMGVALDGDSADTADTLVQIPALGSEDADDESDFELGALEGESSDTSVLLFDDDDDADEGAATMVQKRGDDSEETFDLDAGEAFAEDFDDEIDDDLLGEDDGIDDFADEDDFMADDDDFDESFSDGDSQAGFVAQPGAAVMVEQEWGGAMFAGVMLASVTMIVCALVMIDLVQFLWKNGEYGVVAGPLVDMMGIK